MGGRGLEQQWLTPDRESLISWLEQNAANLAPVYLGALRMATDATFPGRGHFIAHAIREMGNRLPGAIVGKIEGSRAEYRKLADTVHRQWTEAGFPSDGSLPPETRTAIAIPDSDTRAIPRLLLMAISELLIKHRSVSSSNASKARRMFDSLNRGDPIPDRTIKNWFNAIDQYRYAHVQNVELTTANEQEIADSFFAFEQTLLVIARKSYENMDELDALLESANRR